MSRIGLPQKVVRAVPQTEPQRTVPREPEKTPEKELVKADGYAVLA